MRAHVTTKLLFEQLFDTLTQTGHAVLFTDRQCCFSVCALKPGCAQCHHGADPVAAGTMHKDIFIFIEPERLMEKLNVFFGEIAGDQRLGYGNSQDDFRSPIRLHEYLSSPDGCAG